MLLGLPFLNIARFTLTQGSTGVLFSTMKSSHSSQLNMVTPAALLSSESSISMITAVALLLEGCLYQDQEM